MPRPACCWSLPPALGSSVMSLKWVYTDEGRRRNAANARRGGLAAFCLPLSAFAVVGLSMRQHPGAGLGAVTLN